MLTPLRNMIPRVSGKGGIQANWRAITAINTSGLRVGVSAANRGGVMAVATQDYTAAYKGIGIETSVDFEAQYAGQGFDDVRAARRQDGARSADARRGGDDPRRQFFASRSARRRRRSLSDQATGGTLAANTAYSVICVALTLDGVMNAIDRGRHSGRRSPATNADGTSDTFGGGVGEAIRQCRTRHGQ